MGHRTWGTFGLCAAALFCIGFPVDLTAAVHRQTELPEPTRPAPPRDATDLLLKTALAEVLKQPYEFIVPKEGPVLLQQDGPHISAHMLPEHKPSGIAIVSAKHLDALGARSGEAHFYFMTMRVVSTTADSAVVNVQLFPVLKKGHIAMCCWTVDRRYTRTTDGWRFDRVVGGGVY